MAMTSSEGGIWNVADYEAFQDLRLRPALDLLARVSSLVDGDVVDLGCGSGAAASAVCARFPEHSLVGVDNSADMLAKASARGLYNRLDRSDIKDWQPDAEPALIFSNAALHWLDGHRTLIPHLYQSVVVGGQLAIQMPSQLYRPSHQTMIAAAAKVRPDLFDGWTPFPGHLEPGAYAELVQGADIEIWSTEYHQRLPVSADNAHPVRTFSSSTVGLPVLAKLNDDEKALFGASWDALLDEAYPRLPDGGTWFPFRRLFLVARKPVT